MSLEHGNWHDAGDFGVLDHAPDVDIALLLQVRYVENTIRSSLYLFVACTEQRSIACNTHTLNSNVILGDQLMGANALPKIPDADRTRTVAADEFSLVRMDDDIVDSSFVNVVALKTASASVPDLDRTIFRASDHPLALAVKRNASDVVGVSVERHDRIRIGGFDVVEFDIVMTSSR